MLYYINALTLLLALLAQVAGAQTAGAIAYTAEDVIGDYECVTYEGICIPVGTFYEINPENNCASKRVTSPLTFEKIDAATVRITITDHTFSEGCTSNGVIMGACGAKTFIEMTGKIQGRYIFAEGMSHMTMVTPSMQYVYDGQSTASQTYRNDIPQQRTYEIMGNGQLRHVIEQTGKVHVYQKM